MNRPRVLLADDHRMMAECLRNLLHPEFELVGIVEDGLSLIEASKQVRPDVIVADITMPHLNGLDAMVHIKKENPRVKVVFLTMHQDAAYARRALDAGATGFVLKHSAPDELLTAVRAALAGKTYLTPSLAGQVLCDLKRSPQSANDPLASLPPRQREVLQLCAEGRSAKEIASMLAISARTVEFHKYQMMDTLGLRNSNDLTHFAIKHGVVAA